MTSADLSGSLANGEQAVVVAVVAAYRPPSELVDQVRELLPQVSGVIVVDDGSPAGAETVLDQLVELGAIVVRQPRNAGIAAALNAGIGAARQRFSPDFVLTLDQDSVLISDYVAKAVATYRQATAAGLRVGFVSAAAYGAAPAPTQASDDGFVHAFDPMQSGSLIPVSTLAALGGFDESLFIDGVDSEYTARAQQFGLVALVGAGCTMEHDLGRREPASFFGRPVPKLGYSYHSPARIYYITRNGTVLARRYLRSQPGWSLRRLRQECLAHGMRLVLGRHRGRTLLAMLAGYRDALLGRRGPIRPELAARLAAPASDH